MTRTQRRKPSPLNQPVPPLGTAFRRPHHREILARPPLLRTATRILATQAQAQARVPRSRLVQLLEALLVAWEEQHSYSAGYYSTFILSEIIPDKVKTKDTVRTQKPLGLHLLCSPKIKSLQLWLGRSWLWKNVPSLQSLLYCRLWSLLLKSGSRLVEERSLWKRRISLLLK
jgi:hypothetical protein